ncbi:response regulator receiver and unknown domain protein [Hymenobacter roseosalivarius DSM 11622]|uniref:Response regulatory domain-containing protein n=1 Tax=Hymenobacter roseosalivarius DSM 11622 TaxID=645990 RepID=A0A1W1ULS2_9BACT|nr:response regulator [Hymenobacter roseosalivarius]SMB82032.1 response regulator receiver and unknown domain protein [Hymenobacter roseosalivarius DSM 11622]
MKKLPGVLLVDDDFTTNALNERLLKNLDVADQYLTASDGQEALTALDRLSAVATPASPILVLLDVKMPVLDGMGFLEAYQRLPLAQQKAAVIVMHTASMVSEDLDRVEELPIAGLVSKPLTKEKVNTILKIHYQRQFPAS